MSFQQTHLYRPKDISSTYRLSTNLKTTIGLWKSHFARPLVFPPFLFESIMTCFRHRILLQILQHWCLIFKLVHIMVPKCVWNTFLHYGMNKGVTAGKEECAPQFGKHRWWHYFDLSDNHNLVCGYDKVFLTTQGALFFLGTSTWEFGNFSSKSKNHQRALIKKNVCILLISAA